MNPSKVIFIGIVLTGLAAFASAFSVWIRKSKSSDLPSWRKVIFSFAFLAVAAQFLLFALSWTHIGNDYALFIKWRRFVFPSFWVGVVPTLFGKGSPRWWLLLASVLIFVLCFFTMLTP
jgi:hypothetical protein